MNYNFLTVEGVCDDLMVEALAEILDIRPDGIDIADEGNQEKRNWDALVLVNRHAVSGDVAQGWDICAGDEALVSAPEESQAMTKLARKLESVVLYGADPHPPSDYWAVTPEGRKVRVVLMQSHTPPDQFTITRSETSLAV
ncbi:hypothetical protein DSC45_00420 [Streptomyces sp. YIM 130001]|uniref:hypothetical protein n=1 Tax=Streptomyces sp. YIM 130001 TaxID=2259644 RepID=UPI000E64FA5B|nr:hypothetical protein [Streptomyces sp. YIM 130001]RII22177.1 hypothetical protein DSC45_00420 [Streptomyces sp. YIM 130001]